VHHAFAKKPLVPIFTARRRGVRHWCSGGSAAARAATGGPTGAACSFANRSQKTPADAAAAPVQRSGPTLDLDSLENRLRETEAIGFMTKLTLKSQVDELLERFRAHYDGTESVQLTQLRQPYDTLILKVLALLQDKDPALAKAIASSREAIWGILTDREKFLKL
jgi:hypothetical protein